MMRCWKISGIIPAVFMVLMMLAQPVHADQAYPEPTQGLRAMPDNSVPAAPVFRPDDPPPEPRPVAECKRGGCSGELCLDAQSGGMASTCMWSPEFECYATLGVCEKQSSGKCGWTQSKSLKDCIRDKKMGVDR